MTETETIRQLLRSTTLSLWSVECNVGHICVFTASVDCAEYLKYLKNVNSNWCMCGQGCGKLSLASRGMYRTVSPTLGITALKQYHLLGNH